ncbi:MAG: cupin domain-containing protein [Alphaproteobacteria bacterium]|nr:cupin domain-containing protein [Alphaproteobacteria bacterium]
MSAPALTRITANKSVEFYTRERCFITEILNHPDSPDLSLARCRVLAGVTTELHRLKATREVYVIEQGQGLMDDGHSEQLAVKAGDSVTIPAGHGQRIENTGTEDLVFMVICTPRFEPECYQADEG